jgi:hypothetical protein
MTNPSVTAICLTADRQKLTDRAVQCFLSQTYRPSTLLIYDTGTKPYELERLATSRIVIARDGPEMARPIGALRNTANSLAVAADVLIHWDSDDWSGAYRIQDQVQTLMDSGRDCVGYRSVLFWRRIKCKSCDDGRGNILPYCPECGLKYDPARAVPVQEAWAYHNIQPAYCIGASLCYWRRVWVRRHFKDTLPSAAGQGEDKEWLRHVDSLGISDALESSGGTASGLNLVCEIHGANTMPYNLENDERGPTGWKRVPEWDARLQGIMVL